LFHHADRDDLKSVGIAFDGGGIGGVDIRDGGVFTPGAVCEGPSADMMDRGIRYRDRLADAMLGCGLGGLMVVLRCI
jgi:hypothetical protein